VQKFKEAEVEVKRQLRLHSSGNVVSRAPPCLH